MPITATTETLTRFQIAKLEQEAASAGDHDMIVICKKALDGNQKARREVARVIEEKTRS